MISFHWKRTEKILKDYQDTLTLLLMKTVKSYQEKIKIDRKTV